MRPFETADVALIETLKARHETLKAELAAAERQDAQNAAEIAAELREIAGKASAESPRGARGRALTPMVAAAQRKPWWKGFKARSVPDFSDQASRRSRPRLIRGTRSGPTLSEAPSSLRRASSPTYAAAALSTSIPIAITA